ncbi:WhiB family transcriptional regulator [Gordonia malaquae]|uniref:WhiB family transcriptional regulator n=1 Tax=Gordonia malaquae TaxID=410332 RepID=UPI0030FF2FFB
MRRTPESTPCQGRPEFTSDDREVLLRVAMVCFHCPIRVACREGAEARGEQFGVWGGKVFGGHKKPGPKGPRSHCQRGHDLTVEGAVYVSPRGDRECRTCANARSARRWRRIAEAKFNSLNGANQ